MAKRTLCPFPTSARSGATWLYLVGGFDDTVKVGKTARPRWRVTQHMRSFGDNFAWAHLFCAGSGHAEYAAIQRLSKVGQRVGKTETFKSIKKACAIEACRDSIAWRRDMELAREAWAVFKPKQDAAWLAFREQYIASVVPTVRAA